MQDENIPKIIPVNKNITLRSHFSSLSVKKKMHTKIYFKTHKLAEKLQGTDNKDFTFYYFAYVKFRP